MVFLLIIYLKLVDLIEKTFLFLFLSNYHDNMNNYFR